MLIIILNLDIYINIDYKYIYYKHKISEDRILKTAANCDFDQL